MPSNLPTPDSTTRENWGSLYVVATPIGNRDDITLRALKVLEKADLVAAEDTRNTRKLLTFHNIKNQFISYHEHNEKRRTPVLIDKIKAGSSVAVVSNAGTPTVSDPGYQLIKAAVENGIRVIPIPGVSAVIAALSVSAVPTDSFVFIGFPARKKGKRLNLLKELANEGRSLIFYESPKRILTLLEELIITLGDRHGVLAREITKLHEEFIRGLLSEIIDSLKARSDIKGECTLIVMGTAKNESVAPETIRLEIQKRLTEKDTKISSIAKDIAGKYPVSKSKVYAEALKIRKKLTPD
jgi:16S rRNA (cytidine1402-2'-O)-methyltransferase